MKNVLFTELKKALSNRCFIIAISIGIMISLINVVIMESNHISTVNRLAEMQGYIGAGTDPTTHSYSLFRCWMGGDTYTFAFLVFSFISPLLAAFAYSWSYCSEKNNGYTKNVLTSSKSIYYYLSKYISVFVSGGMAVTIPLLFNLLTSAMFLPAVKPDIMYLTYYCVMQTHIWSELFYTHPFAFVFLYLLLDFLFYGLIATMSLALSYFANNKLAVIIIPSIVLLIFHYVRNSFNLDYEISPIYFLHSIPINYNANGMIILFEGVIIFLLTFGTTIFMARKAKLIVNYGA